MTPNEMGSSCNHHIVTSVRQFQQCYGAERLVQGNETTPPAETQTQSPGNGEGETAGRALKCLIRYIKHTELKTIFVFLSSVFIFQ